MSPYSYRYIPASISANAKKGTSPKDQYVELFQKTLDEQFYNSSNWWTIQEETSLGSGIYQTVDVRIAHVINAETGLKLGDDWKTLLFQDVTHNIELGKYYLFDDNTWMVTNIETVKNLTGTCTVRRCNNTLRWIDESTGAYYEEPCIIEYLVKEPRDYATQGSPFMTPGGFLHIQTQFNSATTKIAENQRFLFGNSGHWTCYKVVGTGINDFNNIETYENDSTHILTLDLIANFVNEELDDIVDGIADVYTNIYQVILSSASISGSAGNTIQLTADVLYNGDSVTRQIEWETSDTSIATVSGSGLVTFIGVGACEINASVYKNSATDTCWVTVSSGSANNYEIIMTPSTNYVLEGTTSTYSVYLYTNNVVQGDIFTITCSGSMSGSTVPTTSYTFTQTDGNHFSIENTKKELEAYLTIQCVTGSGLVVPPKSFNIYLRGAWLFGNV